MTKKKTREIDTPDPHLLVVEPTIQLMSGYKGDLSSVIKTQAKDSK